MYQISPALTGLYQAYLQQLKNERELDVREHLFNNFGDSLILYRSASEPDLSSQMIAIPVRDPTGLQLALTGLVNWMAPGQEVFERRDYLGTTLYQLKESWRSESESIAYSLTDGYLFLNFGPDTTLLEETLSLLRRSRETFWACSDIQELLDQLPAYSVSLGYRELDTLLEDGFALLASLQKGIPEVPLCDPEALPEYRPFPFLWFQKRT